MTAESHTNIATIDLLNDNIVDVIQTLTMIVGKDLGIIVEIIPGIKTNRMLIMNGAQRTRHLAKRNKLVKKKNQISKLLASWQKIQIHLME